MPNPERIRSVYTNNMPKPGAYIGRVTNLLDPTLMGGVEVAIERGIPNNSETESEVYPVVYISPFYGVTGVQYDGNNPGNFQDVQKSYGFWMVPPDIGTKVLVMFVEGHPHGYWIGCLPDQFQNYMIPGLAASQDAILSPEQALKYGTKNLPVAEFLKKSIKKNTSPNKQPKPIHPFADRLLAQGLLLDNIRGVTSSSARREAPSSVFGISTPGPLDPNGKKGLAGYETKSPVPVSRLGGTQFVMDDGDNDGQNELVRLRTRTGHQILLHNSSDLIYIANASGTAWLEMTGNGKIDIYAADSVSIHSEADFNFRADRDINLEAGRNINVKSIADTRIESRNDLSILIINDGKLSIKGNFDHVVNEEYRLAVTKDINVLSGNGVYISAEKNVDILSEESIKQSTGGDFHFGASGNFYATADQIHLNGPDADAASASKIARVTSSLPVFSLPNRSTDAGWANGNFYSAGTISSIMQRVPTHEPWDQHENINSAKFSAAATDSMVALTESATNGEVPVANPSTTTASTSAVPENWTEDADFIEKIKELSKKFRCSPVDLLACMAFETGETFSPSIKNKLNGATGLIQFVNATAKSLGTNLTYLSSLTRSQQCEWVDKYFSQTPLVKVKNPSISDLYMSILRPAAVGKPENHVLFKAGSTAYSLNAGLDSTKKGYVTKSDATAKVVAKLDYVRRELNKAGITI